MRGSKLQMFLSIFLVALLSLTPTGLSMETLVQEVDAEGQEAIGSLEGLDANLDANVDATVSPTLNEELASGSSGALTGLSSGPAFEPNLGQSHPDVAFQARTSGYTFFLTDTEAVFVLPGEQAAPEDGLLPEDDEDGLLPEDADEESLDTQPGRVVRMRFVDAADNPTITGQDKRSGVSNYLYGNDPDQWATNVPHYGQVLLPDLWPGIDMVFLTTDEGAVRFDFHVHPGADPNVIRLGFEGGDAQLDEHGELALDSGGSPILIFPPPYSFQQQDGGKVEVESGFYMTGPGEVAFQVAEYDVDDLLVIDPTVLNYNSYLGGGDEDEGHDVGLDSLGFVYVSGNTKSTDFPSKNAHQSHAGGMDAFVTKFTPGADAIVYSTFIGGSTTEDNGGIAIDMDGHAYIIGRTFSTNFPTVNAFQDTKPGGGAVYVAKLGLDGDTLIYSTYLGGSASAEWGFGIAVDGSDHAYVTGYTESFDFPTQNAFQAAHPNQDCTDFHCETGFVTKFSQTGDELVYSTYLGGESRDRAMSVAIDSSGHAYITGHTRSTDFPIENAYIDTRPSLGTAFLTKLDPQGDTLAFSTYLGGSSTARGRAVALDESDHAYVTGHTFGDFPIKNAFQETHPGVRSGFVTKFVVDGSDIIYSTYLGGSENFDDPFDIAVDGSGHAHVIGQTPSPDFPTKNALQDMLLGTMAGFVAMLAPEGDDLHYSTYLGGTGEDRGRGIAVDLDGSVYFTGQTDSSDFPTTSDALQTSNPGSTSAFVGKITPPSCATPGPDAYGYTCAGSDPSFDDISASGTALPLGDDEVSAAIDLTNGGDLDPFLYYGKAYDTVRVSSNGFLTFSDSTQAACCSVSTLPDNTDPDAMVAGYWTDLDPSSGGDIHWTVASNPDRFIVQFTEVPVAIGPHSATFQIVLDYDTHQVHVPYGPVAGHNDFPASAGIEDHDGLVGLSYRHEAFHSPGNEVMDNGDQVYLNIDSGGNPTEIVEENDIRLVADDQPTGAHVTTSDADYASGLVTGIDTALCFFDEDSNQELSIGDSLYLANDRFDCGTVKEGDLRLSATAGQNAGTFVAPSHQDVDLAIDPVAGTRLMYTDVAQNQQFSTGDPVYLKALNGENNEVEPGDYRLTSAPNAMAFTWVGPNDADLMTPLNVFPNDLHIDASNVLSYYDSQKRTVDFTPPEPTVPDPVSIVGHSLAFDNSVTIEWSPPENNGMSHLESYEIYRGETEASMTNYDSVASDQLSYDDPAVPPGETLFYAVAAKNGVGEGDLSESVQIESFDLPSAPQNLVTSADQQAIHLAWDPPLDDGGQPLTGYNVYGSDTQGGPYNLLANLGGGENAFTESGLANGATRYYVVAAENEVGEGGESDEASATTDAVAPDPPLDLIATAGPGEGEITLSWEPPADDGGSPVTDYNFYCSADSGGPYDLMGSQGATGTTATLGGLGNNVTRHCVVTAENDVGESDNSNEASATTFTVEPGAPVNLMATAGPGTGEITLSWEPPTDDGGDTVTDYHIYCSVSSGGPYDLHSSVAAPTTSFTVSGLDPGVTRYCVVTAENSVGENGNSNEASATTFDTPGAPQDLVATAGPGSGEIGFDWEPPFDDGGTQVVAYLIYSGPTSGELAFLDNVSGTQTEYLHTGLPNGETRYYIVSAVNDVGEGPPSDEASATTFDIPSPPQDVDAQRGTGEITVLWNASLDNGGTPITDYEIRASSEPGGPYELVGSVDGNTFSFTEAGLEPDETRCYIVFAENDAGKSEASTEHCATTFDVPDVPSGFDAFTGPLAGEIALSWDGPGITMSESTSLPVTGYNIYGGDSDGGPFELLASVDENTFGFTETGLGDGVQRYYHVNATNDAGEGEATPVRASTTQPFLDPEPLPEARSASAAAFHIDRAFVFGGASEDGNATDSILRFDPASGNSSVSDTVLPSPRLGPAAVLAKGILQGPGAGCHPNCHLDDDAILIFGGDDRRNFDDDFAAACHPNCMESKEILEFNPIDETIEKKDAEFDKGRFGSSAVWNDAKKEAYIFGGFPSEDHDDPSALCHPNCHVGRQIVVYNPIEDTLAQEEGELPVPLGGTSAVWDEEEGVAYIFGGFHDDDADHVSAACHPNCMRMIYVYNPDAQFSAQSVETLPVQLPGDRWNTSAVFDGKDAYIIGGENETGPIDEIVKFDPDAMTVEVVSTLPSSRSQTSAIFDGKDAYVFGGLEEDNVTSDEVVRFTPAAPQQAKAEAGPGPGEATVSWKAPSDEGGSPLQGYRIYRNEPGQPLHLVSQVQVQNESYVDSGLGNGASFDYWVSAVNEVGEGPQGRAGLVTTFALPSAPVDPSAMPGPAFGEVTIDWSPPVDDGGTPVDHYRVYRKNESTGSFELLASVPPSEFSYTDSGLGLLDTHHYKVSAVNLVGEGPRTDEIEGKTFDPLNIYVTPDGISVAEAAALIADGGTIHVAPGTYVGDVEVDNSVTIQPGVADGPAPSVGKLDDSPPVIVGSIEVTGAASLTIRDMHLQAPSGGSLSGVALLTQDVRSVHLENTTVEGSGTPKSGGFFPGLVDLRGVSSVFFVDNTVTGDPQAKGRPSGLRLEYDDGEVFLQIERNLVRDNAGAGIAVTGENPQAQVFIEGNRLTQNRDGLLFYNAVYASFVGEDNDVTDNAEKGVRFVGTVNGESVFRSNRFVDNPVALALSAQSDPVDARLNWWGHTGGPLAGGQTNSPLLDYTPWCVQEDCSQTEILEPALP